MTNESDLLWILLSGRIKGRLGDRNAFPPLSGGEPLLTLGLHGADQEVPKGRQTNVPAPPTWEAGESYLPASGQDTAQCLS